MKNQQKRIILLIIIFIISGVEILFVLSRPNSEPEKSSPETIEQIPEHTQVENETENDSDIIEEIQEEIQEEQKPTENPSPVSSTMNCTASWGPFMLINPNFLVDETFITQRKTELINIEEIYGIHEGNYRNGAPLLDAEAAVHLDEMNLAYSTDYPGQSLSTRSCFRSVGTNCGRLCVATGGSDHHSGYTCDLYDPTYGEELNTDLYSAHLEWQWLRANSYKYGFIDRFPESWAGGSMSEPANIDATGTTGLFETWHYRYVGVSAATEIATGKFNNGNYDSLEHYLLEKGFLSNLLDPTSCNF